MVEVYRNPKIVDDSPMDKVQKKIKSLLNGNETDEAVASIIKYNELYYKLQDNKPLTVNDLLNLHELGVRVNKGLRMYAIENHHVFDDTNTCIKCGRNLVDASQIACEHQNAMPASVPFSKSNSRRRYEEDPTQASREAQLEEKTNERVSMSNEQQRQWNAYVKESRNRMRASAVPLTRLSRRVIVLTPPAMDYRTFVDMASKYMQQDPNKRVYPIENLQLYITQLREHIRIAEEYIKYYTEATDIHFEELGTCVQIKNDLTQRIAMVNEIIEGRKGGKRRTYRKRKALRKALRKTHRRR